MPRYIDADALIAEYDRVHVGPAGGARKLMVEAPTADEAPKSEVAGEIFAEIDKIIIGCRVDEYSKEFGYVVRQNYNGASIVRYLAELKKKYDVTDTNVGSKYFTPEQVRAMSREEVHKNYSAIMESMKTWCGERK